jgi:hypothetical protein
MAAQATETTKRGSGKVLVREADLQRDRRFLIKAFHQHLTTLSDERRYDWLYLENPDGPARVWIAYEGDEENMIGSGSVIPRRVHLGGSEFLAGIMADFWIDPRYRTLGPAVQLQRACMASIDGKAFDLCIDFPKDSMVAVYRRLGITRTVELVRWAKPLRVDDRVAQAVKSPALSKLLSGLGNSLLRLRDFKLRKAKDCEVSVQDKECGDEFSELDRACSTHHGACVVRTAAYLNWRYRAHFHHDYRMLVARRRGIVLGYVVYVEEQGRGQIVDLFGAQESEVLESLVSAAVDEFRARRTALVSAPLLAGEHHRTVLKRCGFHARESVPVVLHSPPAILSAHPELAAENWLLMQGDRES